MGAEARRYCPAPLRIRFCSPQGAARSRRELQPGHLEVGRDGALSPPDLSGGSHGAGSRRTAEQPPPRVGSRRPSCAWRSPLPAPRRRALRRLWVPEALAARALAAVTAAARGLDRQALAALAVTARGSDRQAGQARLQLRLAERPPRPARAAAHRRCRGRTALNFGGRHLQP